MKIWKDGQLNLLKGYPKEVVDSVNEIMSILNDNYETDKIGRASCRERV